MTASRVRLLAVSIGCACAAQVEVDDLVRRAAERLDRRNEAGARILIDRALAQDP